MVYKIFHFFDKLEDQTRERLSRSPLLYALLGGIGVVLFWRGVWHLADEVSLDPILSIIIGAIILLTIGAFVSTFIGSRLIITGLHGEKKLTEKTKDEIDAEEEQIKKLQNSLNRIEDKITTLESDIHHTT